MALQGQSNYTSRHLRERESVRVSESVCEGVSEWPCEQVSEQGKK